MARPKRIDLPFSLYHVMTRTNTGDVAFPDMADERKFLFYVKKYLNLFNYRLHAWCLMPTHFHLLLESTERPALSEFMRRLLTAYTVYFNRRHRRHGHLFQGRFKSYLVDKVNYLLALSRYIHLNPVKDKIAKDPVPYRGSSLKYYVRGGDPPFLFTRETLDYFKGNRKEYEKFIREGLTEDIKPQIIKQAYVGREDFVRRMEQRCGYVRKAGKRLPGNLLKRIDKIRKADLQNAAEVVKKVAQRFGTTPEVIRRGARLRGDIGRARAVSFVLIRETLPWSFREISEFLGLHGKRGLHYYTEKVEGDRNLKKLFEEFMGDKQRKE
jgi:REP element-mobilizing transposase RayT